MSEMIKTVNFADQELECIVEGGEILVSLRRVCEVLGVSQQGQLAKLESKSWAVVKKVFTTGSDGKRYEMSTMPLKQIPMWFATISESAIKDPKIQKWMVKFQNEAVDVLSDHFLGTNYTGQKSEEVVPVLDVYQFLIASAQAMADLNKLQIEAEARLGQFEEDTNKKFEKLTEDLERKGIVPVATMRARINQNVRSAGSKMEGGYKKAWRDLYSQYLIRFGVDLRQRAKNANVSNLDWAEQYGHLLNLYNLSVEMYGDTDLEVDE